MNSAAWTTPADVLAQLQRCWQDGRLLAARVSGMPLFPMTLPLRKPGNRELGERFDEARKWIRSLEEGSKPAIGYGYDIGWRDINHRALGRNRIPSHVVLETEEDALRLLGRRAEAARFGRLADLTQAVLPQLRDWMTRRPMLLLAHAPEWERIVAILQWFLAHPRPAMYLRQLDISGVDGKFIEQRKGLLAELLDQLLPAQAIDAQASGTRLFETRYGLLSKPALIRFRLLDARHYVGGLSDLSVPVNQFACLESAVRRVYITENEINGLAFPDVADSMVIFGGGYGIDRLADISWLRDKEVIYWGDIDTHGFAILDRLRAMLPHVRSVLMDLATLEAHRTMWGNEEVGKRYMGRLAHLTADEQQLLEALQGDVLGPRIRLEQERLGYAWVIAAICDRA
jgi:hypothetical protein